MAYRIQLAASAKDHFSRLNARQQAIFLRAIKIQLQHEPLRDTRNKKRLRPNPLAPWELRVGALRVFYEIDADKSGLVNILAIGVKRENRLLIAGKEIRI